MEPYLPSLAVAATALAIVVLVRRGSATGRAALGVVALLPVHALLIALRPDRGCLLFGSLDRSVTDCIRELNLPSDLLRAHAVLAACAALGLAAWFVARRGPGPFGRG